MGGSSRALTRPPLPFLTLSHRSSARHSHHMWSQTPISFRQVASGSAEVSGAPPASGMANSVRLPPQHAHTHLRNSGLSRVVSRSQPHSATHPRLSLTNPPISFRQEASGAEASGTEASGTASSVRPPSGSVPPPTHTHIHTHAHNHKRAPQKHERKSHSETTTTTLYPRRPTRTALAHVSQHDLTA